MASAQILPVSEIQRTEQQNLVSILNVKMVVTTLVLAIACAFLSAQTKALCGQRSIPSSRVINGQDAAPHTWPWQLSLRRDGKHICGASLVEPGLAITAAHCVIQNKTSSNFTLVAGAHYREHDGKELTISKITYHPGFSFATADHDIAILRLSAPVLLTSSVNTICLPSQGARASLGGNCFISGWGRINSSDMQLLANKLQQSRVSIIENNKCKVKNDCHYKVLDKSMVCAGGAGSSICHGDSGGPLQCEENGHWVLRGVASWVARMHCPGEYYSVYARVSTYIDWIKANRR